MVVAAEQPAVGHVGGAAAGPGDAVVGVAEAGRASHPWAVQPPSRTAIATRIASLWKRRRRPTSRTWLRPPRTTGITPPLQASRRASAAEIRPPVSRVQAPASSRRPRSWSSVIVTTTVAVQPPVRGRALAGYASISCVSAMPCRTGVGKWRSMPPWPSPSPFGRVGEASARTIFCSIRPCRAGIRKRPWQVPSSSSRIVSVVRRSARASCSSSTRPSNDSATSGATTSSTLRPRTARSAASWWAASPTRCASACRRWSERASRRT